jgi:hypothetical protein
MVAVANPALEKFVAQIGNELVLGQVLILRCERGFELRHVQDRSFAPEQLRTLALAELRALARFTASGAFRPLKSAPNLRAGWRALAATNAELETVLNQLYPGALADWFAAQAELPPVTDYRQFTNRQTGMYRITSMLNDAQAAQVIRVACHKGFCLKRRLWTVAGLAPDAPAEKSLIPCLEPCAVLLEFARTAVRLEQTEKIRLDLSVEDAVAVQSALRNALDHPNPAVREADFSAPGNPRRLQLLLEKLQPRLTSAEQTEPESGEEVGRRGG